MTYCETFGEALKSLRSTAFTLRGIDPSNNTLVMALMFQRGVSLYALSS